MVLLPPCFPLLEKYPLAECSQVHLGMLKDGEFCTMNSKETEALWVQEGDVSLLHVVPDPNTKGAAGKEVPEELPVPFSSVCKGS